MRRFLRLASSFLLLCVLTSLPLLSEHTRRWRQSTYEEFLKGTAHGVAVRSDGRLELAPKFTLLADADASYLWSVRLDPKGTLYAAGGSPAKIFRFDSNAKPTVVFDSSDLSAQAIAFDSKGALYAGTSACPDEPLKLGRATDWQDNGGAYTRGRGLRMFLTDDTDRTAMELKEIRFNQKAAG